MKEKRRSSLVQFVVLLLIGGLVIMSLIMPALPDVTPQQQPVEVSVLMRETESTIWSGTRLGMEQAAYDLGGELRFLTPDLDNSHTSQGTLLLREVQGGTGTVVVVPADPPLLEQMIIEHAAAIPVVSIESKLADNRTCISPDNVALGKSLAQAVGDAGRLVLLLDTAGRSTGVQQRLQSCAEELRAVGSSVEVHQLATAAIKEDLPKLVKDTKAEVIIAFEPLATEMIVAAYDSLPQDIEMYGVGATTDIVEALEQNKLSGIAAWSDYAVGYLAVQAAIDAKRGVRVEHSDYNVRFGLVRGEDIYEESNQKLLFPVVN